MKALRAKTTLVAVLAAVLALFLTLAPAEAHAVTPTSASPADQAVLAQPPNQVYLNFPEEIGESGSTLQVLDLQGRQVDLGKGGVDLNDPNHAALVVQLPALPQGVYLVKWQVTLSDGDSSAGAYYFGVGSVTLPADPPAGAASLVRDAGAAPQERGAAAVPWTFAGAALVAATAAIFIVWRRRVSK